MCEEERGSTDGTEVARASDRLFQEEIRPSNGGRARHSLDRASERGPELRLRYRALYALRARVRE